MESRAFARVTRRPRMCVRSRETTRETRDLGPRRALYAINGLRSGSVRGGKNVVEPYPTRGGVRPFPRCPPGSIAREEKSGCHKALVWLLHVGATGCEYHNPTAQESRQVFTFPMTWDILSLFFDIRKAPIRFLNSIEILCPWPIVVPHLPSNVPLTQCPCVGFGYYPPRCSCPLLITLATC